MDWELQEKKGQTVMSEVKENQASGFIRQGTILAAASIIVRIIGLLYRIPMANILGDEGNGIYSAAFEIYNILLIISSYGMPLAVSKMISARCVHHEYRSAYRIFGYALVFSATSGLLMGLIVFFGADFFEKLFDYEGVAIPLRVLAPTIFIVAVMGVFRGLFQGRNTMIPTALSQVIEQIINAFVSVIAAYVLMKNHSASKDISAWGAAGGTLGTCLGAVGALIILLLVFWLNYPTIQREKRRDRVSDYELPEEIIQLILITILPIILSQTIYQISGVIDLFIFSKLMHAAGHKSVSSLQGVYSTDYRLLVSVPIAVSTAIASSMIPSMVASHAMRDESAVEKKLNMAVQFNMLVAFPSAVGLAVLGRPILQLLFPNTDYILGSHILLVGSSCIIFYALSTTTSAVLQSIDHMKEPVYHSLWSLIIHILLVSGLLKFSEAGVFALVIGNVTYPLVVCALNGISIKKYLGVRQEVVKTYAVPLLCSVIMGALSIGTYKLIYLVIHSNVVALVPAFCVALLSYFVAVIKLGGVSKSELYQFPMGGRLVRLAYRLQLMKPE